MHIAQVLIVCIALVAIFRIVRSAVKHEKRGRYLPMDKGSLLERQLSAQFRNNIPGGKI